MGIELKKGENVFYPAPYVPSEPALIIITDKRVVYFGDDGRQEMESHKVSFVGRMSGRPFLVACIVMVLLGLPLAGYGAYTWYQVKDMKSFSELPPMTEDPGYEDPQITRYKAIAMMIVGAVLCVGAWKLVKKKRYIVAVRGGDTLMKIKVPDEMKQTQVVMTLQAMQQTAKAMKGQGGAAAPAAPAAKT